jgi:hypothetical protein
MDVSLKNIEKTPLDVQAYEKLIKKYCRCSKDVHVIFDKRLKSTFGNYFFNEEKDCHEIRISIFANRFLEETAMIYAYVSTTLHELRHAEQKEELGNNFDNKKYSCTEEIKSPRLTEFFSKIEVDARIYENKNILEAVKFYNNSCK